MTQHIHKIKAKSHILVLLGNELIGNDGLAIFELVKNAYDADAEKVTIQFVDLNTPSQKIIIEDDGYGMSSDTINNIWLTVGTDSKRGANKKPSPKGRISLGEKGVGRLAVHKLARKITLETQTNGSLFSSRLSIDWPKLIASQEFIQDLQVEIDWIGDSLFEKGHGTRIILSDLYNTKWTKASLRELVRKIEQIINPFTEIPDFKIEVEAGEYNNWLSGLKTPTQILNDSLYQFQFEILPSPKPENLTERGLEDYLNSHASYKWSYCFNPPHQIKELESKGSKVLEDRLTNNSNFHTFQIGDIFNNIDIVHENTLLQNKDLVGIGSIRGLFFVFNQNSKILTNQFGGQVTAIKSYIKENCGVRIYRDNIRVYNYGEPSDDWLGLDLMKIQRTSGHFGKKVTIGSVELDLSESSKGLVEKTNREGFNENECYRKLRALVRLVFQNFEKQAQEDRDEVEEYLTKDKPVNKIGFSETLVELTQKLTEKNLTDEFSPLLKRVEKDYLEMRDLMLNSGMTGLNLGIVFHEVDREMRFIDKELNTSDLNIDEIKGRINNLVLLLENISPILKQNEKIKIKASELAEHAKYIHRHRFNYHDIIFSSPLISKESADFQITGPGNLLVTMLSNLVDNSIYWDRVKRDETGGDYKCGILITSDLNTFDGPAIIIADNGTGFSEDIEVLVRAFKTTKPGGMGLGLYYSNMVMEILGGKLLFPDSSDLDIPQIYNGACIALVFPK